MQVLLITAARRLGADMTMLSAIDDITSSLAFDVDAHATLRTAVSASLQGDAACWQRAQ